MFLAVVELALSVLVSNTALRNDQLPVGARISLAAYGLAALVGGVCTIAALLLLLSGVRRSSVHPAVRWIVGGVQTVLLFASVLLYGS
jgi:hypothetical protein